MVERVDKVEGQIMTVRSTLKTEAYLAADYKSKSQELKTEILSEVNQRLTALEMRLTHQMNEDRQHGNSPEKEINDLVAAVRDGQQKTWGAIERISKDLQELIQKDAGTDGEDEEDPCTRRLLIWIQQNQLLLEHPRLAPLGPGWKEYLKKRNPA